MTSWRDVLPVHPAADLFDMMPIEELKALGEDIKNSGLQTPVVVDGRRRHLLDGRKRLDAMEMIGIEIISANGILTVPTVTAPPDADPYAFVASANLHRRHLSHEEKRRAAGKLLEANPEASNRQIAEQIGFDHKTVGKIRQEKEAVGEIPQQARVKGKDGKSFFKARKPRINVAEELENNRERIDQLLRAGRTPPLSDNAAAKILKIDPTTIRAARAAGARDKAEARLEAAVAARNKALALCRDTDSDAIKNALSSFFELAELEQVRFLEIIQKERLAAKERTAVQLAADRAEARTLLQSNYDPDPEPEPAPAPRKRGRPKGSKNKPKGVAP
jgi:hypothetical protein